MPRTRPLLHPAALALLVSAAACHLPAPTPARLPHAPEAPARWTRAVDVVPVRLAPAEGAARLEFDADGRRLAVERVGAQLVADDGRRGTLLRVDAGADGVLRLLGQAHPGPVWVEPHPDGGLRATAHVPLEEYVTGVVAAELVLWSALPAELEAQAIAARSYALAALAARGAGAFLWSDTRDQVYRGRFEPGTDAGSRRAGAQLLAACERSAGLVLMRAGEVLDARFHAACGGHGAAFADVFPLEAPAWARPGVGGAPCEPCARIGAEEGRTLAEPKAGESLTRGKVRWKVTLKAEELARLARELGLGERLVALRPARADLHGRWLEVELVGERGLARLELGELRRRLGHGTVLSGRVVATWPRLGDPIGEGLYLEGLGRGHGVGLCQIGAREYAAAGWTSEAILLHHYPEARPTRLPAAPRP